MCLRKGLILCFQLRKCDVRCAQIQYGILPEIQVCEKPLGGEEGESLLLRAMVKLLCMLAFSCVAPYWMQGAVNEELMQIKARNEEVATMQEDLVNRRAQRVPDTRPEPEVFVDTRTRPDFFFKIIGYFGYRVFQKMLTFASI